jgi:tripartite-type tricarboxylate transporter receptor subunit TctC
MAFGPGKTAMNTRRAFLASLAAIGAAGHIGKAAAQAFPTRPISMDMPFAAGGPGDVLARMLAARMGRSLGQNVIVENVTGAAGSIGTGELARATPDGYSLLIGNWTTNVVNAVAYKLNYDVVKDFEPIALVATQPVMIIARKNFPADNLKELIAWLKANPDKATFGTAGPGSPPDLLARLLRTQTGTQFSVVAYRGAAPAMQDVIAGHIDAVFITIAAAQSQVTAGTVKALGMTWQKRISIAPEIPTMDEAGLRNFYFALWSALFVPRGTPQTIVQKLNAAAVKTLADPAVRQKFEAQGCIIPSREEQTADSLRSYQKAEIAKWWPVVKAAGIKPD